MTRVLVQSRRELLQVVLGAFLIPIASPVLKAEAAAELPQVPAADPVAQALKYVTDASKAADAKPGSKCASCALYQGGTAAQGGCPLFPGKAVEAAGWCISWTARKQPGA